MAQPGQCIWHDCVARASRIPRRRHDLESRRLMTLAFRAPDFYRLRLKRGSDKLSQAVRELLTAVPWGCQANWLAEVSDLSSRL